MGYSVPLSGFGPSPKLNRRPKRTQTRKSALKVFGLELLKRMHASSLDFNLSYLTATILN